VIPAVWFTTNVDAPRKSLPGSPPPRGGRPSLAPSPASAATAIAGQPPPQPKFLASLLGNLEPPPPRNRPRSRQKTTTEGAPRPPLPANRADPREPIFASAPPGDEWRTFARPVSVLPPAPGAPPAQRGHRLSLSDRGSSTAVARAPRRDGASAGRSGPAPRPHLEENVVAPPREEAAAVAVGPAHRLRPTFLGPGRAFTLRRRRS